MLFSTLCIILHIKLNAAAAAAAANLVACSRLSDSGEDAKVKGKRKVFSRFISVFRLSQFSGPDYLGAWNGLQI